jgi:hypothetical protein
MTDMLPNPEGFDTPESLANYWRAYASEVERDRAALRAQLQSQPEGGELEETTNPITEDWLKSAGFKFHQLERQPDRHWLLWLGDATRERHSFTSWEDIGIEVARCAWKDRADRWFCWFRSDSAGRYSRFIHIRHMSRINDLIRLIEAITGQTWDPANNLYGSMRKPEDAERIRFEDRERLDRRIMLERKWADIETDNTRGRALPDHVTAAIKGGGAK